MMNKTVKKGLFPWVFLLTFIIICLFAFNSLNTVVNELTYDEFLQNINNNEIVELTITEKIRTNTYQIVGKLNDYDENESFIILSPFW